MTQDQAHERLKDHYQILCESVVDAYQRYRKYPRRTIHRRATRAGVVNDEIIAGVIESFHDIPNAYPVEIRRKNLRFLKVGDDVLLWFKKTDRRHRPSIYPTDHAVSLEAGGQISMFPDCTILVVGYLLNRDETKVVRVSIAKPAGRRRLPEWCIDIEPISDAKLKVIPRDKAEGGPRFKIVVKKSPVQEELL